MAQNDNVPLAQKALTIILAGGRGTRLMNLTDSQAKPAVPFGGSFRIIDFTLSNCMNSGFHRIVMLTQYMAEGLTDYLTKVWEPVFRRPEKFIELRASTEERQYEGTADAIFKNIDEIQNHEAEWILILAGDHIYKMDYAAMLKEHVDNNADVTIPCIEVPRSEAAGFGVMHIDATSRIINFLEKPKDPPGMPDNPDMALASMGIYIFNKKLLLETLRKDALDEASEHDFGKNIIPNMVKTVKVMAHRFTDSCVRSSHDAEAYWRDVGTIDNYWAAHMDMTQDLPGLDVNDHKWPIFKEDDHLPPPQFTTFNKEGHPSVINSIVSPGCVVMGANIRQSLLFNRVKVSVNSAVQESVLLPGSSVGKNVSLHKAIVDHDTHIPDGLTVGQNAEEDARRFHRTGQGIVLITREMVNALAS